MIEAVLNVCALYTKYLQMLVGDLDAEQIVFQPVGVPNHPAWTIGHLAFAGQLLAAEIGLERWLPTDFSEKFAPGSKPLQSAAAYPSKDCLLQMLADTNRRLQRGLAGMTAEDFAKPVPTERIRAYFPTVGDLTVQIISAHTGYHVGQLALWRRAAGFPNPLTSTKA